MDDTQASTKASEAAAAATRKRRSSILKSQRPPRTPFSELEFNVATPTDTAKSRRVSFSRRTGVAEFVTNEATTTWKNFYEEQNKSLESSGNESAANARPVSIGHIGKSIFDQQFEEVEYVDIGGALQTNSAVQEFQTSLNNNNLTQQFAALETTGDDRKLRPPTQNFDLSPLTDHHSKVFGDELSIPVMTEMSNPISINFSNIQPLSSNSKCDDLDEIQRDLERKKLSNVVCPGPFTERDLSEYIEIDLNMTNVGVRSDDCDMSITDTIQSPKVQEVVKSNMSIVRDKKLTVNDDWLVDKENIAINPYATPNESLNFAVNEASDEVLVFDGKKLTVQLEKKAFKDGLHNLNVANKIPSASKDRDAMPKRKTIVLNTDDDLPNFIPVNPVIVNQNYNVLKDAVEAKNSVIFNDFDLSLTQPIDNKIVGVSIPKRQTIVFNDDTGDISLTQAVPSKVIIEKEEKRKTILYDNELPNISMTQALPSNIISANKSMIEKRKTIVFEDGDISFTRALPTNLILEENKKPSQNNTVYFQDGLDISVTQAIPQNIMAANLENIESIKKDVTNLSMTQALPSNILLNETKNNVQKTVIYDQDAEIDTTQAVPDNAIISNKSNSEKRKTIVYEQDAGNISITQVIPTNILFDIEKKVLNTSASIIPGNSINKSLFNCENNFESDKVQKIEEGLKENKTIYDVEADISFTKVMSNNILQSTEGENKMEITSCDTDISMTRALPTNILLSAEEQNKNEVFEPINKNNISIFDNANKTEIKDVSNAIGNISKFFQESKLYANDVSNLSLTKPIPAEILIVQNDISKREMEVNESLFKATNISTVNQDILVYQTAEQNVTKSNDINKSYIKIEDEKLSNISLEQNNESVKHDLSDNLNESVSIKESNDNSFNNSNKNQNEYENELERECVNEMELLSVTSHKSAVAHTEQSNKPKKSILNELLDMSCSLDDVNERPPSDNIEVNNSGLKIIKDNITTTVEKESNDSILVIKDSENYLKTEEIKENCTKDNRINKKLPKISYELEKKESEHELLQQTVDELKLANEDNRKSLNRHYEKVLSSDLRKSGSVLDKSNVNNDQNISRGKKSFHNADNTKELLQMLSDITEDHNDKEEKNNTLPTSDIKASTSYENKSEPKRFRSIPKRQSIALSREELLTSISMAQAALRQSHFDIDESGSIEDTRDSSEDEEDFETTEAPRKSVRMSTDVVKTLHFEEEDSTLDVSMTADIKRSPLKKTAFGDVSYITENKSRVIPAYLNDVSDGVKALMRDLVKPMPDMMPHENVELNKTKKSPSTCSTQIQANLITSSQIDIDVELRSTPESVVDIESNQSIVTEVAAMGNKAVTHALRQSIKCVSSHVALEIEQKPTMETKIKMSVARQSIPGPVIVFDHTNPLNNILLTQTECTKVHKYDPLSSNAEEKEISISEKSNITKVEVENVSVHYNIESQSLNQSRIENKTFDSKSIESNNSKALSVDRSTEGIVRDVKDTEVNTLIAMKGNQDLLESNSSLTLVDDTITHPAFDVKFESEVDIQKSPLQVIYKMDTDDEQLHKMDSDFTSNDDFEKEDFSENNTNTRKRSYSPTKQDKKRLSRPIEITPKPLNKMQKISNSPQVMNSKDREESKSQKIESNVDQKSPNKSMFSPEKRSPKKRNSTKREEVITVQQLITECYRDSAIDKKIDKHILKQALRDVPSESLVTETLSRTIGAKSVDTVSESSAKETEDTGSEVSRTISAVGSSVSQENWQPQVVDELSSKNLLAECSSSEDVVAKINKLPFMGSRDCEWESSGGDVWMFRLLRTHLRLTVRLAHSHHNSSRTRVRADTALSAVSIESVQEENDPLAELCVRLAGEAMRRKCARCERAGDVPGALRRCAAVARVAPRWARAMRAAYVRLAFVVTPDGDVTLKVANIPLRAVWVVRLQVSLAAGAGGAGGAGGSYPRAELRDVRALLPAPAPPAATLRRFIDSARADWGHAPDAIWKIFRYMKNKTTIEDDLLGL